MTDSTSPDEQGEQGEQVRVHHEPADQRYVAQVGDTAAGFVAYRRDGERVVLLHTEVDPSFEGRGVGSALAKGTLDALRSDGAAVVMQCPFIAEYVQRHPEYSDLVVGE